MPDSTLTGKDLAYRIGGYLESDSRNVAANIVFDYADELAYPDQPGECVDAYDAAAHVFGELKLAGHGDAATEATIYAKKYVDEK